VPSQRFGDVVSDLKKLGTVRDESISAQDVTKEYADLETRLAVKEQTVARLRALIDSHTAKLADVLRVEQELAREITELEQMKGERKYYDQQIAMSTIRLSLFESTPTRIAQMSSPIAQALHNSLQVLGNSIGTIIYLLVAALPWAAMTLLVVWLVKPLRVKFMPSRGA
jgi:septal ring factor EnvC (AmiA/AmiB activator)